MPNQTASSFISGTRQTEFESKKRSAYAGHLTIDFSHCKDVFQPLSSGCIAVREPCWKLPVKTSSESSDSTSRFRTDVDRWHAVVGRDHSANASFVYAVKTTGIYCRPSCAAKLARRENVRFFNTPSDAERAGFRACKRCHPRDRPLSEQHQDAVARTCRLLETADETLGLDELADAVSLSPSHLHRVFKAATGLTPKQYATAHRAQRLRDQIGGNTTITTAALNAGFRSQSRLYETSTRTLGMTPTQVRRRGKNAVIRFAVGECSLGSILVAASEVGVCAISLGDDPAVLVKELEDRFSLAELIGGDAKFEAYVAQVIALVERPSAGLNLPLDIQGTAFQRRVWELLTKIPCEQTTTYTKLAEQLGKPEAVRAVASACAANQIAIAIPCHRVVRRDGSLAGYRWGVERKAALLQLEQQADEAINSPKSPRRESSK